MSAVLAPTGPSTSSPETGARPRRLRWPLVVGAALVVALVVGFATSGDEEQFSTPHDPRNTGGDGAQAVAEVLADEGVDVVVVRSSAELADATIDGDTTVLVTSADRLSPRTVRDLRQQARPAGGLVLTDPPLYVSDEIEDLSASISGDTDEVAADCAEGSLDGRFDDLELTVDTATTYAGLPGCFPVDGDPIIATGRDGITYLGAPDALTNDQVLRGDNAAVVLRLLGARERLVWYVPSFDDTVGDEPVTLRQLTPDWIPLSLWMGALAVLGLMLWRGRRLGPLAVEPLLVTVRAAETAHSRGRMYRRTGDRPHAAQALRAGSRRRLAARLALGRHAEVDELVAVVAEETGRSPDEVHALLSPAGHVPVTDHQLIHLASELARLETEVRRG